MLRYHFPSNASLLLELMAPVLADAADYFIGCDVSPCVFEMYWRLRGMTDALTDMAADLGLAREMFRRCADFSVQLAEAACDRMPLDWLWAGDDVAAQQGMMMSPVGLARLEIKPELARIFAVGKQRGLLVAYHCCGALRPIIGDLIEIGLDVLNPIQCNCPEMVAVTQAGVRRSAGVHGRGGHAGCAALGHGRRGAPRHAALIEGMTADGGGYILAACRTPFPRKRPTTISSSCTPKQGSAAEIFDRAAGIRARLSAGSAALPDAIASPSRSAVAMASSSRSDPPGWIQAVTPAAAAASMPSANGKNASEPMTAPIDR